MQSKDAVTTFDKKDPTKFFSSTKIFQILNFYQMGAAGILNDLKTKIWGVLDFYEGKVSAIIECPSTKLLFPA